MSEVVLFFQISDTMQSLLDQPHIAEQYSSQDIFDTYIHGVCKEEQHQLTNMSNTSNTMLQQHIDILQNTLIHRVMTSSNLFPDRKEIEGEFSLLQSKLRMYVYWIDQNDMHESRLALGDALDTIETIRDALAETN